MDGGGGMNKKTNVKRVFRRLIILFVCVFLLRFAYEVFFTSHDIVVRYDTTYESVSVKSNIATNRVTQKDAKGSVITLDQKYDKTARLSMQTDAFDDVNDKMRAIIDQNGAVIQTENLSGLAGAQRLDLSIGVIPDRFDAVVEALKELGRLQSFTVQKIDKTDEYRSMMAEMETLEKTRASYAALKEAGGDIQDLLLLEEKLLEVERLLQATSVDAGLYASENSFCTVNVTLLETAVQSTSVRFLLSCARSSFFWTLAAFFVITVLALLIYALALGFVMVSGRLRNPPSSPPVVDDAPTLHDPDGPIEP